LSQKSSPEDDAGLCPGVEQIRGVPRWLFHDGNSQFFLAPKAEAGETRTNAESIASQDSHTSGQLVVLLK
jgi:hypothetical protein